MTIVNEITARHFSKKTLKALEKKNIDVIDITWVPGKDGSFANGETAYELNICGTSCLRTFLEVLELAK